jgi:hypothetical protein
MADENVVGHNQTYRALILFNNNLNGSLSAVWPAFSLYLYLCELRALLCINLRPPGEWEISAEGRKDREDLMGIAGARSLA